MNPKVPSIPTRVASTIEIHRFTASIPPSPELPVVCTVRAIATVVAVVLVDAREVEVGGNVDAGDTGGIDALAAEVGDAATVVVVVVGTVRGTVVGATRCTVGGGVGTVWCSVVVVLGIVVGTGGRDVVVVVGCRPSSNVETSSVNIICSDIYSHPPVIATRRARACLHPFRWESAGLELAQVAQDGVSVRVHVLDLVRLGDDALGIDEVAVALREVHLLGARCSSLVRHPDLLRDVGQQPEREVELVAESSVGFGRVERDPEDLAIEPLELLGLITQTLALNRSTGRVGHRVPPQQHPSTTQIRQPHGIAVVVDNRLELGRFHPCGQHGPDDTRPPSMVVTIAFGPETIAAA